MSIVGSIFASLTVPVLVTLIYLLYYNLHEEFLQPDELLMRVPGNVPGALDGNLSAGGTFQCIFNRCCSLRQLT